MSQDPQDRDTEPSEAHLWEYVHVLVRRRKLVVAVFLMVTVLAAVRTLLTRPVYEGTVSILIERADPNVVTFKDVTQVDAARDDYYQTQYKLLQSRSLIRRVVEQMNLLADPEFGGPLGEQEIAVAKAAPPGASPTMEGAITTFASRVEVTPVKNSRIVNVSFESYRPELAASAANRLAAMYIQQALDFRFQTNSQAGEWLGGQVEERRKKVEELDQELSVLKQREGLVNIEERRGLLEQRLKELGTALNERKTERLQKEALWRQMSSAANPEQLPEVMRSPLVQNLRIELANLERQQAQLLEKYLEQHPEVTKVRNQITETRGKIRGEARAVIGAAENDYKAAAAQEYSMASALEAAKAEAQDLSRRTVGYESQKRELDAANQVLSSLLSRSKETDVTSDLKSSNIRIVDPAVTPGRPIKPRKVRDILLGMLLGVGLGMAVAFFLDYLDNTLKTPDDVRTHLGAPLLGVVPEVGEGGATLTILNSEEGTPFVEGYRVIRTSLGYSWPESGARVVLVTSTAPGEGKTLTAVNLALILATTQSKVLLIDCDLRKPHTHTHLKGRRTPGLSDVLVGKTKPSETIQQRMLGSPLSLLSAGTSAPSPADLLTNRSVQGVLEAARKVYDWIIVDTPPVGAVAEPLMLAPLADGVVVVAGAEMVPRRAVQHTIERLNDTGARVLGVVLNRAQIDKHSSYYGHYYGRYYGHYGTRHEEPPRPSNADGRDKVTAFPGRKRARG